MRPHLRLFAGLLVLGAAVGCNDEAAFPWYFYADADGSGADVSDAGGDTGASDAPDDASDADVPDGAEPDTTLPDTGEPDTGDTDPFDTGTFDTGTDTSPFDTGSLDTSPFDTFEPPDTDVDVELPPTGLRVVLTWETPGASGSGDTGFGTGADVDLHLVRGSGCWEDPVTDCHYVSRSPEWGAPGPDDNPSLLLDDVDGLGPEIIVLPEPEPDVVYRIGVHYYNDHGFGLSTALVQVFLDDEEIFEASFELEQTDAWVYAADFMTGDVILVGSTWESTPPCP